MVQVWEQADSQVQAGIPWEEWELEILISMNCCLLVSMALILVVPAVRSGWVGEVAVEVAWEEEGAEGADLVD